MLTGLNPWTVMAHFLLSMVLIALAVGAVVQLLLVPVLGTTFRNFATAVVVLATMVLAWVLRDRKAEHAAPGDESLP